MQGASSWVLPSGPLGRLTAVAHQRVSVLRRGELGWRERAEAAPAPPSLWDALGQGSSVAVIAELKRASPSGGSLNTAMDIGARAGAYVAGGAVALSVLTEPTEFGGDSSHLQQARRATAVPLLKKDFHVDEVQILEARALGASALLLIARALEPERLEHLVAFTFQAGVEPVVEVRSASELERALAAGARILGVNARNLETLVIEPRVVETLLPRIPVHCIAIAESGMATVDHVRRIATFGADAVLIGSALSVADNPTDAVAALVGVERSNRAA